MAAFDELAVILHAHKRARIAGEHDDGQRAEDSVDGAALEAELTQIGA